MVKPRKYNVSKIFQQGTKVKKIVLMYENHELEYTFPRPVLIGEFIKVLRELGEKQNYGKMYK